MTIDYGILLREAMLPFGVVKLDTPVYVVEQLNANCAPELLTYTNIGDVLGSILAGADYSRALYVGTDKQKAELIHQSALKTHEHIQAIKAG